MEFSASYVEAVRRIEDLIQIMFEKLSRSCKYCELTPKKKNQPGPGHNTCLYYGRTGRQRCGREVCPVLEEEEY